MATLVSPGVDVQIIDESIYGAAGAGTIPLIIIATATNKTGPSGTGIAPWTAPAKAGKLFLATSQRELVQNFGNPIFYTANGTPLHGHELNEYGLHAAYSYLGISNRAYVLRADLDLAALQPSDTAPRGEPLPGTYWLDLVETRWGVFQSNGSPNAGSAWLSQPVRVTTASDITELFVPRSTFGRDGEFAVVPQTTDNFIYERISGTWHRVGTASWRAARPTILRGATNPGALTPGDSFSVNSVAVTLTGTTLADAITAINGAAIPDIVADQINGAIQLRNTAGENIVLANLTGTPLTTLGLPVGLSKGVQVFRNNDASYPAGSVAGDVWVKGNPANLGAEWKVRVYNGTTGLWVTVTAPFYVFDSALADGDAAKDIAAKAAQGNPATGALYVGYDVTTGVQELRRWSGTRWESLVYEADNVAPSTPPQDGVLWYSTSLRADLMVNDGDQWIGYRRRYPNTDPNGVQIAGSAPMTQSDGTPLVDNDLWIDSSDLENYPALFRYDATARRWRAVDKTDQTTPFGVVFADARENSGVSFTGMLNAGAYVYESEAPADMALSDFLDPDAPDPRTYPADLMLFNTRYSTGNVKVWRPNHFVDGGYDANTNYEQDGYTVGNPLYTFPALGDGNGGRWVTASGNDADGSALMLRKAQRIMIVRAMSATVQQNEDIRSEIVSYNLLSAPGYPEMIDELIALNVDQKEVSFIVGDTPARLRAQATAIQEWAGNANAASSNGEVGLTSASPYVGIYYPWGLGQNIDGTEVMIPPSTMALRVMAYNDQVSYPWMAPAGFNRGIVTNATTVGYLTSEGEFEPALLNEGQRNVLYVNRINPIAFFPGRGLVVNGQKTLSPTVSSLDRVNVARLANYLKVQLDALVKPFLFEANTEQTREAAKITVERFLNGLVGLNAVYDYVVLCDTSNNTPERIDRNELWIDVLVKPVKAVEFIYVPVRLRSTGDDLNI